MALLPSLQELQIQERSNGESLVGWGSRHVVVGREMLAIIKSLASADSLQLAFSGYREAGGRLEFDEFSTQAARCRSLFDSHDGVRDQAIKWRVELFDSPAVQRVSPWLRSMFRLPFAAVGIAVAVVAVGFVFAGFQWSEVVACSIASISAPQLLVAVSIVVFSVLFHEIGHAAGLVSFGQNPGPIGFGFYLGILPVFFTDLSRSWRLRVRDRIVVSLGGVYFQLIFSTLMIGISAIWKSDFLLAAGLGSAVLALFQLIPVARSDGFWILADLLGEPRLGRYEHSLWRDWRRPSAAGRSARRRLSYQGLNFLFMASMFAFAFGRAKLFASDLLQYVQTGFAAESLSSAAAYLSFLIFALLLFRVSGSLLRVLLTHAISARNRLQAQG